MTKESCYGVDQVEQWRISFVWLELVDYLYYNSFALGKLWVEYTSRIGNLEGRHDLYATSAMRGKGNSLHIPVCRKITKINKFRMRWCKQWNKTNVISHLILFIWYGTGCSCLNNIFRWAVQKRWQRRQYCKIMDALAHGTKFVRRLVCHAQLS